MGRGAPRATRPFSLSSAVAVAVLLQGAGGPARSDIVTDGTLGPQQRLTGPDFVVPNSLGSQFGANLFHSFQVFDVLAGQGATFTGPDSVANVISRVTGGNPSRIDGLLSNRVGSSDFYFINPAGVLFGPNASVDVPAAFHVSTADEIRFADGSVFSATDPASSTLTLAAPEAFGFLGDGDGVGPVEVDGSDLRFAAGSRVSLSGRDVSVTGASLDDSGGELSLVAVGDDAMTLGDATSSRGDGSLDIEASLLDVRADGGGAIFISGGDIRVVDSVIAASNLGDRDASGDIAIEARTLDVNASQIGAHAIGQGSAGDIVVTVDQGMEIRGGGQLSSAASAGGDGAGIVIRAGDLTIDGSGAVDRLTAVISGADFGGTGNGGDIDVSVTDSLRIRNGGGVRASTESAGNAGNIIVQAANLVFDDNGTGPPGIPSAIAADALAFSTGDAGTVRVRVQGDLQILDGGQITSAVGGFTLGNAGAVIAEADNLLLENGALIASNALQLSAGDAGVVQVLVRDTANILNGSRVTSDTNGEGNAGTVTVKAAEILVEGMLAGISSNALLLAAGNAGTVDVIATETLAVLDGAEISSDTNAEGDAGEVAVRAGSLLVDGRGNGFLFTGISSEAVAGSGNAGSVSVTVDDTLELFDRGQISTDTATAGNAGDVAVAAADLVIDGRGELTATGVSSESGFGATGDAGSVRVEVRGSLQLVNGGLISSDTFSAGDAGEVTVEAGNLLIDRQGGSFTAISSASLSSPAGNAGAVRVKVTDTAVILNGGRIDGSTLTEGDAGDVLVEAAELVIDGQGADRVTGVTTNTRGRGSAGTITVEGALLTIRGGPGEGLAGIRSAAESADSSGDVGDIFITANTLRLVEGGRISIENESLSEIVGTSVGLNRIEIQAVDVELSNGSSISAQSFGVIPAGGIRINTAKGVMALDSAITTQASEGDGGAISIGGNYLFLSSSLVTTSVEGLAGDGGDITLTPQALALNSGFIQANTAAVGAAGGDISISSPVLIPSNGELLVGGVERQAFREGVNVIQAAAPDGVSGVIQVSTPQLDVTAASTAPSSEFLDLGDVAANPCTAAGTAAQSSLVSVGRGGLPPTPADPAAVFLGKERLERALRRQRQHSGAGDGEPAAPRVPPAGPRINLGPDPGDCRLGAR